MRYLYKGCGLILVLSVLSVWHYNSYFSVEPPENCDQRLIEEYEELTKILICTLCRQRVATHSELRQHMLALHSVEVELTAYSMHISLIIEDKHLRLVLTMIKDTFLAAAMHTLFFSH